MYECIEKKINNLSRFSIMYRKTRCEAYIHKFLVLNMKTKISHTNKNPEKY